MAASPAILSTRSDTTLSITINRPEKLNSLDEAARAELLERFRAGGSDRTVRAIVLSGAGRAFCAGEDLAEVAGPQGDPELFRRIVSQYNELVTVIRELDRPVICAVNGVAAGAGANLALACDFVIAAETASFIQSFVNIGLVPDTGGSFFLPRLVGLARARELMMLGEKCPAAEAARLGMIYRAVPAERLDEEAHDLARRLATLPGEAIARIKRMLDRSFTNDLAAQLAIELQQQGAAAASSDYREGVQAFLEKRPPRFGGG